MPRLFAFSLLLFLIQSCGSPSVQPSKSNYSLWKSEVKYAKCFDILTKNDSVKLVIYDPFNNYHIQNEFNLVRSANRNNDILVPVKKMGAFSSTFLGMIEILDGVSHVKAIESSQFLYSKTFLNLLNENQLFEAGTGNNRNIEKIILEGLDVVIIIGYGSQSDPLNEKLEQAGIKVLSNYDWQESHPLARAEWVKFFGALLNKRKEANEIFDSIAANYFRLKDLAQQSGVPTEIMYASGYQGTWYVPGGKSYIAQLIQDANASYPWISDTTLGSIPLSYEAVVHKSLNAQAWLAPNCGSMAEVLKEDSRNANFKAYKTGQIFNNDKLRLHQGGNGYYELSTLRADWLLSDIVKITHPQIVTDSLYFYRQLK